MENLECNFLGIDASLMGSVADGFQSDEFVVIGNSSEMEKSLDMRTNVLDEEVGVSADVPLGLFNICNLVLDWDSFVGIPHPNI